MTAYKLLDKRRAKKQRKMEARILKAFRENLTPLASYIYRSHDTAYSIPKYEWKAQGFPIFIPFEDKE
jgi:hypothetical protein